MPTKKELEEQNEAMAAQNAAMAEALAQLTKSETSEAPEPTSAPVARTQLVRESGGRGVNLVGIAVLMIMFFVGLATVVGVGTWVYATVTQGQPDDTRPAPDERIDDRLVDDIERARITEQHAIYFAKVANGIANRIEADGDSDEPRLSQRKDIADNLGDVGYWAVIGSDAANYRDLPSIIESSLDGVFETDSDGNVKGGTLTDDDREEVVKRFRTLSSAFMEVAN